MRTAYDFDGGVRGKYAGNMTREPISFCLIQTWPSYSERQIGESGFALFGWHHQGSKAEGVRLVFTLSKSRHQALSIISELLNGALAV
jgi:hypothetical protein